MPPLSLPPFAINLEPYNTVTDSVEGLVNQARSLPLCPDSITFYQTFIRLSNRYQRALASLSNRTSLLFNAAPGVSPAHLTPRGLALVDVRIIHSLQTLTRELQADLVGVVQEAQMKCDGICGDEALGLIAQAVRDGDRLGLEGVSAALRAGASEEEIHLAESGDNEQFNVAILHHSNPTTTGLALPAKTG